MIIFFPFFFFPDLAFLWRSQVPDASVPVPNVSGSLPEVSGDVSVPSAGGVDFDVSVPSVGMDASAPSASIDVPGERRTAGVFLVSLCP